MGVLVGLIVVIKSYSGKVSGILMIGIGIYYAQKETLMREHAVGVAGICTRFLQCQNGTSVLASGKPA